MEKNYNKETFCVAPWIASHLITFGNVVPCCLYKQERVFGELKQGVPLDEMYNSDVAKDIRKRKNFAEGICNGWCHFLRYKSKNI